jgi:hypothetical protein
MRALEQQSPLCGISTHLSFVALYELMDLPNRPADELLSAPMGGVQLMSIYGLSELMFDIVQVHLRRAVPLSQGCPLVRRTLELQQCTINQKTQQILSHWQIQPSCPGSQLQQCQTQQSIMKVQHSAQI